MGGPPGNDGAEDMRVTAAAGLVFVGTDNMQILKAIGVAVGALGRAPVPLIHPVSIPGRKRVRKRAGIEIAMGG